MIDFINRYFKDTAGEKIGVNKPATSEQISILEKQLAIKLPEDYKTFLISTNGFKGHLNEFVVDFCPVDKVYELTKDACEEFFPWAIYIGTNGNLEMFVIDKRQRPYQFGLLPFIAAEEDFISLGDTFEKFIEQLYNGAAF